MKRETREGGFDKRKEERFRGNKKDKICSRGTRKSKNVEQEVTNYWHIVEKG